MTDPRELLGAYAATISDEGDYTSWTIEEDAPKAFAALRAVLDIHTPEDADPDRDPGKTFCCTGCIDAYGDYHTYPCRTVKAITTALEAK